MSVRRALAAVVATSMMVGLVVASPAQAVEPVAAGAKTQQPRKPVTFPKELKRKGKTRILAGPLRTNAGQKVQVVVKATHRKSGKPASGRDVATLYKPNGRTRVRLSGRTAMRVKIILKAPAVEGYSAFRVHQTYLTKRSKRYDGPYRSQLVGASGPGQVFTKVLGWLVESIASQGVGMVFGWAMGAIFGSGGDQNLQPIMDQLNEIKAQLNIISEKIDQLSRQVDFNACQAQTTAAARAVGVITDANDQLLTLVKSKESNAKELDRWSDQVLAVGGIGASLKEIHNVVAGLAGTNGSIGACGKAYRNNWKVALDEASYYDQIWAYTSFFMQTQLLASNLVVEAAHYKAVAKWKESGKPLPKPADIAKVCVDNPNSYCERAKQVTTDLYYNLVTQSTLTGAAFSWNPAAKAEKGFVMAAQKDSTLVWVRELGAYQRNGCEPSSVPDRPCGTTVSKTSLPSGTWMGYNWQMASPDQWANLLDTKKNGDRRISEIMESLGFASGKNNKLIVYAGLRESKKGDRATSWDGGFEGNEHQALAPLPSGSPPKLMCMFDTNFIAYKNWNRWPICASDGNYFDALMNRFHADPDQTYYYDTSTFAYDNSSNRGFYNGLLKGTWTNSSGRVNYAPMAFASGRLPGWAAIDYNGAQVGQYTWPVMDVSNDSIYKCETLQVGGKQFPMSKYNAGGALTMCRNDFATWLKSWMGEAPKA